MTEPTIEECIKRLEMLHVEAKEDNHIWYDETYGATIAFLHDRRRLKAMLDDQHVVRVLLEWAAEQRHVSDSILLAHNQVDAWDKERER